MSEIEKIAEKLQKEFDEAVEFKEPLDYAGWADQYGILITPNEAKAIIDHIKGKQTA